MQLLECLCTSTCVIVVEPSTFDLTSNQTVYKEGEQVSVSCNSGSSNPTATLRLHALGDVITAQERDGAHNAKALSAEHQFQALREHHRARVWCELIYNGIAKNQTLELIVYCKY